MKNVFPIIVLISLTSCENTTPPQMSYNEKFCYRPNKEISILTEEERICSIELTGEGCVPTLIQYPWIAKSSVAKYPWPPNAGPCELKSILLSFDSDVNCKMFIKMNNGNVFSREFKINEECYQY